MNFKEAILAVILSMLLGSAATWLAINSNEVKYIDLPEEIGLAKPGDTLTVLVENDTIFIRFNNFSSHDKFDYKIIVK